MSKPHFLQHFQATCRPVSGQYELQDANPLWMPEIGLGIGSERANYDGVMREWLYWYDEDNRRYPTPYEQIQLERQQTQLERQRADRERQQTQLERQRADRERQRAEVEQQRAERLAAKLRELGIEPD